MSKSIRPFKSRRRLLRPTRGPIKEAPLDITPGRHAERIRFARGAFQLADPIGFIGCDSELAKLQMERRCLTL
jgi:hypothetical protein